MTADFDPYQEWFGIPPHDQPPDHYRLLGLARFESDPDAIRRAADQRMVFVRKFQTGPKGVHTQPLLNKLAAAKLCLLDAVTKASYDAVLLGQQAAGATATTSSTPRSPTAGDPSLPPRVGSTPAMPTPFAGASPELGRPTMPTTDGAMTADVEQPVWAEPDEEPEPFYLRTWFLAVMLGLLALLGGLAVGLWAILSRPNGDEPVVPQVLEEPEDEEPPPIEALPVLVYPEEGGEVNLIASTALRRGDLRLVIRGAADVIAGWSSSQYSASWRFKVLQGGFYRVEMDYAVTEDAEGCVVDVQVAGTQKEHTVSMRGGPGAFKTDEFFLAIPEGEHTLTVRAATPTPQGLMELKSIRLSPR
jgi:hypothetical protein